MIAYHNGCYRSESEINIPLTCSGFQYAYGVFTSLRTKDGIALDLDKHILRLKTSCAKLKLTFAQVDYKEIISNLLVLNKKDDLRIKIIIYEDLGGESSLIILTSQLNLLQEAIRIKVISHTYQANDFRNIKSLNYLEQVFLHRLANKQGYDEGLLVNSQGMICECCYANIFFSKKGKIYTPKANNNILNGIMRQEIIDKYPVEEVDIYLNDLASFEQAFISNSVQGVVAVKSIDDIEFSPWLIEGIERLRD
jgi:4-amino-4-deoxychorismate lyase